MKGIGFPMVENPVLSVVFIAQGAVLPFPRIDEYVPVSSLSESFPALSESSSQTG